MAANNANTILHQIHNQAYWALQACNNNNAKLALEHATNLIKQFDEYFLAHYVYGYIQSMWLDVEKVESSISKMEKISKGSQATDKELMSIYLLQGCSLSTCGNTYASISYFNKALDLAPDRNDVSNNFGIVSTGGIQEYIDINLLYQAHDTVEEYNATIKAKNKYKNVKNTDNGNVDSSDKINTKMNDFIKDLKEKLMIKEIKNEEMFISLMKSHEFVNKVENGQNHEKLFILCLILRFMGKSKVISHFVKNFLDNGNIVNVNGKSSMVSLALQPFVIDHRYNMIIHDFARFMVYPKDLIPLTKYYIKIIGASVFEAVPNIPNLVLYLIGQYVIGIELNSIIIDFEEIDKIPKSVFNDAYQCKVLKCWFMPCMFTLLFDVRGDMSLGKLQNAIGSTLTVHFSKKTGVNVNNIAANGNDGDTMTLYAESVSFEIEDEKSQLKGKLNYYFDELLINALKNDEIWFKIFFTFGIGGYSPAEIFNSRNCDREELKTVLISQ